MSQKYRLKLNNGRIVGPFSLDQVEELLKNSRLQPGDQCQQFPVGDWVSLKEIDEVSELVERIGFAKVEEKPTAAKQQDQTKVLSKKDRKNGFTEFKFGKGDGTQSIINYKELEKKYQDQDQDSEKPAKRREHKDFSFSETEVRSDLSLAADRHEIERLRKEEESKQKQKIREAKMAEIKARQEERAAAKEEVEQGPDKTVVNKPIKDIAVSDELEKTVISKNPLPPMAEPEEEPEETEPKGPAAQEVQQEPEDETIDTDGATQVVNISELMPELKSDVAKSEKEIEKRIKLKKKEDSQKYVDSFEDDFEDDDEEEEESGGKKKLLIMVMIAAAAIFFFLSPEEKKQVKKEAAIDIVWGQIDFPITREYEEAEKSKEAFREGLKHYSQKGYLHKVKASKLFKASLEMKFKGNEALGYLILAYAELLPDAKEKRKAAKTIFDLIKLAKSSELKDINIAIGVAMLYFNIGKYNTARMRVENFLRLGKPSIKLFAVYLDILRKDGDFVQAKLVYDRLINIEKKSVEVYTALISYLEAVEKGDEAKSLLKTAVKQHSDSVSLLLRYSDLQLENGEFDRYSATLDEVNKRNAERSPRFYAKYLEQMGILSAIKKNNVKAVQYFERALKINDSDELRSKLASLELGGKSQTESLILESKSIAQMKKAQEAMAQSNWEEALRFAIEATDLASSYIPAQLLLSEIQIQRGYYMDALKTLEGLADAHPTNANVISDLIMAYINSYKLEEAMKRLTTVKNTDFRSTPEYASLLGYYYEKNGNYVLSIQWFQKAVNRDPIGDNYYFELAKLFLKFKKYDKAKLMLTKAIGLDPENVKYRSLFASILYELESTETAIGYLRDVLKSNPDNPLVLGEIAIYYYKSGQQAEFEKYKILIDKSTSVDANFYKFLLDSAKINEKFDEIVKYSKELMKINPGDLESRMTLGIYYYDVNKLDESEAAFTEIKERLVSFPKLHYYLAKIQVKRGNFKEAVKMAELEIKHNPTLEFGYYALGLAYKESGSFTEAIKQLERANSINRKSVETLQLLGWIKFKQNLLNEARELYLSAIKEDQGNAQLHKEIGHVYKAEGQGALAVESFKLYLDIVPNAEDRSQIEQLIRMLQ